MDGWLVEGRGEAQPWQDFGLAPDQEATAPACSDWPELTSVILRQGICLYAFTGALISRQGLAAGRQWHGLCKFRRSSPPSDVDSSTDCGYCRLLETNLRIIHLANVAKCRCQGRGRWCRTDTSVAPLRAHAKRSPPLLHHRLPYNPLHYTLHPHIAGAGHQSERQSEVLKMGRATEGVGLLISCVVGSVVTRSEGSPHSVVWSWPPEVRYVAGASPPDPKC